jgi:hypothetical protein
VQILKPGENIPALWNPFAIETQPNLSGSNFQIYYQLLFLWL